MYNFCIFAGTTEGRELTELLLDQGAAVTACVATEYGETLLPEHEHLTVSAGALDEEEMTALLRQGDFELVIDATHPYAAAATESIAGAARRAGVGVLRLLRPGGALPEGSVRVDSPAEAARFLDGTDGNILLATGSGTLAAYAGIRDFSRRAWARVLPTAAALRLCAKAGLPPSHIVAMQGPFSKDMNAALLRQTGAAWLVTKDDGDAGGFGEKADAARAAGAKLLVVGRPPQREGLDYGETVAYLCRRYGFRLRPEVTLVGIGPGDRGGMTADALEAVAGADCLIGARRMLAAVSVRPGVPTVEAVAPEAVERAIQERPGCRRFAVLLSGDTGFYSGAKRLLGRLEGCRVRVLPGLSSLSVLCAALGASYEDVVCVSLHGRSRDIAPLVRRHPRLFVLTGGERGMEQLLRRLCEAGLGDVTVHVGERLSYPDQRLRSGAVEDLVSGRFSPLAVALLENPAAEDSFVPGLPDETFTRGGQTQPVPMTKREVRALCLSLLRPTETAVCWDVGAGTGSVSVELAMVARRGEVYAVERREDALGLLRENRRRFGLDNLYIVPGEAPAALADLPAPSHVFLGGSGGKAREILALALEKNPQVRVVAPAVTLETQAALTECMKTLPLRDTEVCVLQTARSRAAGAYHLLRGLDPVTVFTLQGGEAAP